MLYVEEAVIVVLVGIAIFYACDYSAHHRTHEVFHTTAGAHQETHCSGAERHPTVHQYFPAQWRGRESRDKKKMARDTVPGECFFAKDYEDSRRTFRLLATQAKADELVDLPPVRDDLTTTVAVLRGGDPHKFLVHISGTHGVEAYAGTAVQFGILQLLRDRSELNNQSASPTVVLVHALNPYGFAHNRRVNEDNIDLNRNFLSPEQWKMVKERDANYAGYVDVFDALNPSSRPFRSIALNEVYSLLQTLRAALSIGVGKLKRAMVSGNYHFPKGYGYGGEGPTQSTKNIMAFLVDHLKIPSEAQALVMLDVHTGLGPLGVDTLFFAENDKFSERDLERIFPSEVDPKNADLVIGALKGSSLGGNTVKDAKDSSVDSLASHSRAKSEARDVVAGYELTIGTTESLCAHDLAPHLSGDNRVCVTQEFGTVPVLMVGKYAVDENFAHFYGSDREKAFYGKKLLDCFYVQTNDWRRSVFHRGIQLFLEAFDHLQRL